MACYSCGRGFYEECIYPDNPCSQIIISEDSTDRAYEFGKYLDEDATPGLDWQKNDSDVVDPKSTGRKRAAKLYPLNRKSPCEWLGLKFAGGNKPIIGCVNGLQRQRHHGPDKDTLNNRSGNVHRICDNCHARWHTVNDEGYDWSVPYDERMPHDTETKASIEEQAQNEVYWANTKSVAPGGGKAVMD